MPWEAKPYVEPGWYISRPYGVFLTRTGRRTV